MTVAPAFFGIRDTSTCDYDNGLSAVCSRIAYRVYLGIFTVTTMVFALFDLKKQKRLQT